MSVITTIVIILVLLGVIAICYFLFQWAINSMGLGEPFTKIANIVLVLAVLIAVLLVVLPRILALAGAA
jgi:uncharacterized membrane protein YidH (DUF202 family)